MGAETHWFAVQVKGRFEQTVSESLQHRGYEVFLPTYKSRRSWSDRTAHLDLPLFPGYTFCQMELLRRLPVLTTPGVRAIVGFGKTPASIPDEEIEAIKTVLTAGSRVLPWPQLEPGQRVRIERGPLRGVTGVVLRNGKSDRLVVGVTLLQRSVSVELEGAWLGAEGPEFTGSAAWGVARGPA